MNVASTVDTASVVDPNTSVSIRVQSISRMSPDAPDRKKQASTTARMGDALIQRPARAPSRRPAAEAQFVLRCQSAEEVGAPAVVRAEHEARTVAVREHERRLRLRQRRQVLKQLGPRRAVEVHVGVGPATAQRQLAGGHPDVIRGELPDALQCLADRHEREGQLLDR